jgi:hypothetical protein
MERTAKRRGFTTCAPLIYTIALIGCNARDSVTESYSESSVSTEEIATISQALLTDPEVSTNTQNFLDSDSARPNTDPNADVRPYVLPPSFGPTIPTINTIPLVICAGVATQITLAGQSFTNTVVEQSMTYDPTVVLSLLDAARTTVASYVITPDSFTEAALQFTIPANVPCGVYNVRVVKAIGTALEVKSNDIPIVIYCGPVITSAVIRGTVLTVTGYCFGPSAPPVRLFVLHVGPPRTLVQCTISSWTNTSITATCPDTVPGDTVLVPFGSRMLSAVIKK